MPRRKPPPLSPEEQIEAQELTSEKRSEAQKRSWAKLTPEQRAERMRPAIEANALNPPSKPKLSQESRDAIVEALHGGATITMASQITRVPIRTVEKWLHKGRDALEEWAAQVEEITPDGGDPPEDDLPELDVYASFGLDAAEALGHRNLRWLKALEAWDEKGQGWMKYAWLLERTTPDEFALKENVVRRLELTGAGGGPVRTEMKGTGLAAVIGVLKAAGALPELEGGDARSRKALPAAPDLLAEPGDGESAAGGAALLGGGDGR